MRPSDRHRRDPYFILNPSPPIEPSYQETLETHSSPAQPQLPTKTHEPPFLPNTTNEPSTMITFSRYAKNTKPSSPGDDNNGDEDTADVNRCSTTFSTTRIVIASRECQGWELESAVDDDSLLATHGSCSEGGFNFVEFQSKHAIPEHLAMDLFVILGTRPEFQINCDTDAGFSVKFATDRTGACADRFVWFFSGSGPDGRF